MILFYFVIISVVFALFTFFNNNKILDYICAILYSLMQIGISVYSYQNINTFDSVYFRFDSLSVLMNVLLSIILIPVFYHSRFYLNRHVPEFNMRSRFLSLLIILSSALSCIYFTDNIVIIWVCLEITTIVVTFLIYHERYTAALEAAWKYLFISSFGIIVAFIGILLLSVHGHRVSESGFSYVNLIKNAKNIDPFFLKAAFLLLVTGYSVKLNIFPLYTATIDAKTTAPFPVNAVASTVLINGGFVAIFRIYSIILNTDSGLWAKNVLLIIGLLSLLIVAIQLFKVKRFKKMYAFSSMEHMALVIIAMSLGRTGLYAALLHLTLHSIAKTGMFLHFGQIRAYFNSGWIYETGGYMRLNGRSALAYIFGLITITAIPPSGMFVSEFLILKALFAEGQYLIIFLIIALLIVIVYVMFHYSAQFLYGDLPESFNIKTSIVNKYEPISQFILFGLVFYLAYFTPSFLNQLMNSVVQILN
jgi:hydrogenase-4 component F